MSSENIILTGFMGTGKTTVGRTLAAELGYEFVDTDVLIESRIGMSIAEFFREQGEAAFRKIESELAQELSHRQGLVISTGGRMMLDPTNALALSKTGLVFCLVAAPEEILQRVSGDGNVRPLLQGPDSLEQIVELLEQRAEGYKRFPQIETTGKLPQTIAHELAERVQNKRDCY
jgi:shikimate kinase